MTSETLITLLDGQPMGRVERPRGGRLQFRYEETWRHARGSTPLSLSLPLARAKHPPETVEAFLWGLLPDNETILERWARRFQVSARNVFGLLAEIGEECAGAVQFVRPDRVDRLEEEDAGVKWLDEVDIARRLQTLRKDHSAWRMVTDTGRFSLAGAQPKTALQRRGDAWGIPCGREPTTHILKPPIPDFDGHVQNEHVCLSLARALGLPAARSEIVRFGNEVAIAIERYDRIETAGRIRRIHQEDFCQALGRHPAAKYQSDGGPGPEDVAHVLRNHSSRPAEDVATFVAALAFNWLIGGTDAHAKNFSLLFGGGPSVRLAPLYDLASILPYPDVDTHRIRMAMKIGGKYRVRDVVGRHWRKLATALRLNEEDVLQRVRGMAERLPDAMDVIVARARAEGLDHPIIEALGDRLEERASECRRALA